MPYLQSNGIRLAYQHSGRGGRTILLIMGSAAAGYAWDMHQTPALHRAGYATVTFDNRGSRRRTPHRASTRWRTWSPTPRA